MGRPQPKKRTVPISDACPAASRSAQAAWLRNADALTISEGIGVVLNEKCA